MKRTCFLVCLVGMVVLGANAYAAVPLGGLAVAVSPKGDVLACAGDNRVLYVLDAAKIEVVARVWLGVSVVDLGFNKDGSLLLAEDTDGTLHQFDAKTYTPLKQAKKAQQMSPARAADLVAGLDPDYNGHVIRILSMADLSEKGKVAFAKGEKVAAFGLDAQGARLAVLLEAVADEAEPKGAQVPKDLKGLEAEEFRLKNDGKTSRLMVFKTQDGSKLSEHTLFYSPGSSGWKVFFKGEDILAVNYSNVNARINAKGEVQLFQLENSYNYGMGLSADQKILLTGGLADGTYTVVEGPVQTRFQPDRLPGWPEYFKGFAIAADGTAYGATSGWRIVKIKPGGAFEKSVPVF